MNKNLQNNDSQLDFLIKNMAEQHQAELPSAGLIWWRAQIQKKLADRERVERPMVIMRAVAVAVMLAFVAGIAVVNWSEIGATAAGESGLFVVLGVFAAAVLVVAGSSVFRESAKKS
ncbi:MAG: hypothetical protein ACM3SW_09485 [Actinomycetota bacterium]